MIEPFNFDSRRALALDLLARDSSLSCKSDLLGGQLVVDHTLMTEKQSAWFEQLLDRAGLSEGEA